MNATTEPFAPVKIGTSPAGIEWVAYKSENVETMTKRLALHWERHNARVVTVRGLSETFLSYIPGHFMVESAEDVLTIGATFVRGPRCALADIADMAWEASDYIPEQYASLSNAQTDAQYAFAERGIRVCLETGAKRIRAALGTS